ncbi:MAG: SpoIIE family protein phosphatase [Alphaproteobacteria bacterium]|nr:SpoIIE family protein phosphatase [Alphaproteobacteria bacterium]
MFQASPTTPVRRTLARKVFLATVPVVALVVLLTQLAIGLQRHDQQWAALEARATQVARLTAEAVSRPLWTLDRPIFESQLRAIERDPAFLGARILDEDGKAVFEHGDPSFETDALRARADIPDPTSAGTLGRVEVVLSTAELSRSLWRETVIGVSAFAVLLLGFLGTLDVALRRLVARPLSVLLDAMGRVERKRWETVAWASDDEIGRVTAAFNRMVDGLRSGDEARRLLDELTAAHAELERANAQVLESIRYARRLQDGLMPAPGALDGAMAGIALLWEPLQVVSGDYCWFERLPDGRCVVALVDCTGHGVPGAFMTLVVASALDRILHDQNETAPARVLDLLDAMVRERLRQDRPDDRAGGSDDGADAAICVWDPAAKTLRYAGASIPLLVVTPGGVSEIRPTRASLGYRSLRPRTAFAEVTLSVEPGTTFHLATDGVVGLMGGTPARQFGRTRLHAVLAGLPGLEPAEQIARVRDTLDAYRDAEARRDDITLVAFRPV